MDDQEAWGRGWYTHAYNRADLYRLAGALGWLPRRALLGLARMIGRLAPRVMPVERAVVEAGAVRFRPMLLTALAVIVGSAATQVAPGMRVRALPGAREGAPPGVREGAPPAAGPGA